MAANNVPTGFEVTIEPAGYAVVSMVSEPVNTLSLDFWKGLTSILDACEADPKVRGILLRSGLKRDVFTAGNDIKELYAPMTSGERYKCGSVDLEVVFFIWGVDDADVGVWPGGRDNTGYIYFIPLLLQGLLAELKQISGSAVRLPSGHCRCHSGRVPCWRLLHLHGLRLPHHDGEWPHW